MKKLFSLAVAALLLVSCKPAQYVQRVDVVSNNMSETDAGYQYSDDNVIISYNFWADGGNPGFVVSNETDEILYLDLTKSFYVSGGQAKDYFLNRTFTSSNSFAQTGQQSTTGTAVGTWWPSGVLGSIGKTISSGLAKGSSKGVNYEEKPIIAIPPHTTKSVSEYNICTSPLQECSVALFPSGKDNSSYTFKRGEAPEFCNYIDYRVGENGADVLIKNEFYISTFTNMSLKKATKEEKVGCEKTKSVRLFKKTSPTSFYIMYNNNTDNTYSSDAKSGF